MRVCVCVYLYLCFFFSLVHACSSRACSNANMKIVAGGSIDVFFFSERDNASEKSKQANQVKRKEKLQANNNRNAS